MTATVAKLVSVVGATVKSEAQQVGLSMAGSNQTISLRPVD